MPFVPARLSHANALYGITPFTLQDFPNHTACIVWFCGCNMRCQYCHNPDMIRSAKAGQYPLEDLFEFLHKRQGKLDGVVLTGGEATLYPDLVTLIQEIRALGFKIKLDTNGLRPHVVRQLLDAELLDFIALDYKATPETFRTITGNNKFGLFAETLDMLCHQQNDPHPVAYELRTTVHTDLLTEHDVETIVTDAKQRGSRAPHYIQNYRHAQTQGGIADQK